MSLLNELSGELLKRYVTAARKSRAQARKGVKGDPVKDKALRHIADNPGQSYHHVYSKVQVKERPKRKAEYQSKSGPHKDQKKHGYDHRYNAWRRIQKHVRPGDVVDRNKDARNFRRGNVHAGSTRHEKEGRTTAAALHPSKSLRTWANRGKGIKRATDRLKEEKVNAGLLRWMTNATRRRPKPKPKNEALEQPDVMYTDLRKALNDTHYDTGMELLRKDEKHVKKSATADLNHLKDKIAYLKRQNSKRKTAISSIRRG